MNFGSPFDMLQTVENAVDWYYQRSKIHHFRVTMKEKWKLRETSSYDGCTPSWYGIYDQNAQSVVNAPSI